MLVLTRKVGQTITIGHDIRITIMDIRGGQVKLGVEAPREIAIHREEIYRRIQEENIAAAQALLSDVEVAAQAWRKKVEENGGEDSH